MSKKKAIIGLVVFGIGVGLISFLSWVSISQQKLLAYDAESYSPYGLKAVALLLQRSGYSVTVSNGLPADRRGTVILVTTGPISAGEKLKLLHWIAGGGTLVELSAVEPSLNPNSYSMNRFRKPATHSFSAQLMDPFTFQYHLDNTEVYAADHPEQGFFGMGDAYFIYRQTFGEGSLITWNDIDGVTNRYLKRFPDNAVILTMLIQAYAPSHRVNFYNLAFMTVKPNLGRHKGFVFGRFWVAGLLLFIGIVLLIWKLAARFGRPRPLQLIRGRSYFEFIDSMANLFQRANIQQLVLDNLRHELQKVIAELIHSPSTDPLEIQIDKLSQNTGADYSPVLELLSSSSGNPQKNKLSKQQFLKTASALDDYRKELMKWRKSRQFVAR